MTRKSSSPIHVIVSETHWDAFGAETVSSYFKYALLKRNGVSNTVPPGEYTFDVKRRGLKLVGIFTPNNQ